MKYLFGIGRAALTVIKANKKDVVFGGLLAYEIAEQAEIIPPISSGIKPIVDAIVNASADKENIITYSLSIKENAIVESNSQEGSPKILQVIDKYKTSPKTSIVGPSFYNNYQILPSRRIQEVAEHVEPILLVDTEVIDDTETLPFNTLEKRTATLVAKPIATVCNSFFDTTIDMHEDLQLSNWKNVAIIIDSTSSLKQEILRCNTLLTLNSKLKYDISNIHEDLNFILKNINNYVTTHNLDFNVDDKVCIDNYVRRVSNTYYLNNEFRSDGYLNNSPVISREGNLSTQNQDASSSASTNVASSSAQNNMQNASYSVSTGAPSSAQNQMQMEVLQPRTHTEHSPNVVASPMSTLNSNSQLQDLTAEIASLQHHFPSSQQLMHQSLQAQMTDDDAFLVQRRIEQRIEALESDPNYNLRVLQEKIRLLEEKKQNQIHTLSENINILETSYKQKIQQLKDVFSINNKKLELLEIRAKDNLQKLKNLLTSSNFLTWTAIGIAVGIFLYKNPTILSFFAQKCVSIIKAIDVSKITEALKEQKSDASTTIVRDLVSEKPIVTPKSTEEVTSEIIKILSRSKIVKLIKK